MEVTSTMRAALVLLVLLGACDEDEDRAGTDAGEAGSDAGEAGSDGGEAGTGGEPAEPCHDTAPLAEYCGGHESLCALGPAALARQLCETTSDDETEFELSRSANACGGVSLLDESFYAGTRYHFDESGELVGVSLFSDHCPDSDQPPGMSHNYGELCDPIRDQETVECGAIDEDAGMDEDGGLATP